MRGVNNASVTLCAVAFYEHLGSVFGVVSDCYLCTGRAWGIIDCGVLGGSVVYKGARKNSNVLIVINNSASCALVILKVSRIDIEIAVVIENSANTAVSALFG